MPDTLHMVSDTERARGCCPEQGPDLNPAMLIASAINGRGNIELPEADSETAGSVRRIEYCLEGDGEIVRQDQGAVRPLNMTEFAAALSRRLGPVTPALFRVATSTSDASPELALPGKAHDEMRMKTLRDAFSIYLVAYEERLI